jgi:hypothetical protein
MSFLLFFTWLRATQAAHSFMMRKNGRRLPFLPQHRNNSELVNLLKNEKSLPANRAYWFKNEA